MDGERTPQKKVSFFSRKVSMGIFLAAILLAVLDGILARPYLIHDNPATIWDAGAIEKDPGSYPYKKDYRFTTDWFSTNIPTWAAAIKSYRGKPDVRYLEVGSWEGRSLLWVADNILTHPTSHLTAIDPLMDDPGWPDSKDIKGTLFSNVELSGAADRINVIVGFSQIELRKLPLESYDIIYIDGSHESSDTLEDLVLSFRLLKPGGLLIMDDYQHYVTRGTFERPKYSMDAFYATFHSKFDVVHYGWQVILKKKEAETQS